MQPDLCISPSILADTFDAVTVFDVRKPKARQVSGFKIVQSRFYHPFEAALWVERFRGHRLVIYCVHGHEVSQAVCGFLRDEGVDCRYLTGGFAAWQAFGGPVCALDNGGDRI